MQGPFFGTKPQKWHAIWCPPPQFTLLFSILAMRLPTSLTVLSVFKLEAYGLASEPKLRSASSRHL